ncbi:putative transporter [Lachnellula hyalina]|uniref:Putative transporter n=1 Tax=Lachnellula hyalina TaxID=1316788 RepID=A0A8H8R909_9HELO|nr:putative transporter [Lachnellula hyalina]TVY30845.1 putative transporter [Lachnellula hyalina]
MQQPLPSGEIPPEASSDLEPVAKGSNELSVPTSNEVELDPSQDGLYSWICVACVFLLNMHTFGINGCYGIFLSYYLSSNTFPGATYIDYALVNGLSISQALFVSPLVTYTTRLYGTRTTLLIGSFLEASALIGASFSTSIWHLFLSQGVCSGWGMGFLFLGTIGIVPQWFTKRRSLAAGLASAGAGTGGLVYNLAANAIIRNISLRWAYRILAIIAFTINSTCAFFIKDRNQRIGAVQKVFDYKLFSDAEFLALSAWSVFSIIGYVILSFSLPAYALSIGLTTQQGAIIGSMLNLAQAVGRPCVGYFSDRVGRINMTAIASLACGLACLCIWIPARGFAVVVLFAIFSGLFVGNNWAATAPVSAEMFGIQLLPSILSTLWLLQTLPGTFAELIALGLRRKGGQNTYRPTQIFTGILYVGAALLMWFIRARRVQQSQPNMDCSQTSSSPQDQSLARRNRSSDIRLFRAALQWKKV